MVFKSITDYQAELIKRIREIRLAANITQLEFAKKCGVNVNTIRRIEAGYDFSVSTLLRIMQAFQRIDEFDVILKPEPIVDILSTTPQPQRQRARAKK